MKPTLRYLTLSGLALASCAAAMLARPNLPVTKLPRTHEQVMGSPTRLVAKARDGRHSDPQEAQAQSGMPRDEGTTIGPPPKVSDAKSLADGRTRAAHAALLAELPALRLADLNEVERHRLTEALEKRKVQAAEIAQKMLTGETPDDAALAEASFKTDDIVRDILGDARYADYKANEERAEREMIEANFSARFRAFVDTLKLTNDQVAIAEPIMRDYETNTQLASEDDTTSAADGTVSSDEIVSRWLQDREQSRQGIVEILRPLLTEAQQIALQEWANNEDTREASLVN